jgi:hypothetical protein
MQAKIYFIVFLSIIILTIASIFFIFLQKQEENILISPLDEIKAKPEKDIDNNADIDLKNLEIEIQKPVSKSPEIVKAIYMTSWTASKKDFIDRAIKLAKNTEINGLVIDIKDWSGYIAYDTAISEAEKYKAKSIRIKNIDSFIQKLKKQEIYLIARITVFQDPVLAQARPDLAIKSLSDPSSLWLDNTGLAWIDPAAKESWDYNIAIAEEALELGFDEINFDYIRFPSDGNLRNMNFPFWDKNVPKHLVIKEFFEYLRQELPQAKLSADLFGLSTVNSDDLGIGQVIEDAFEYFDYVCPMVYPSHYAVGFLGYQNPAQYPYQIVKYSMESALKRLSASDNQSNPKLRPWLQDFSLGAVYDVEMVEDQIRAVYDALEDDFNGFMLWNSSNIYTEQAFNYIYPK